MLDGSFILATSAIHLITVVPACPLGLTLAKVTLSSLIIHPSGQKERGRYRKRGGDTELNAY